MFDLLLLALIGLGGALAARALAVIGLFFVQVLIVCGLFASWHFTDISWITVLAGSMLFPAVYVLFGTQGRVEALPMSPAPGTPLPHRRGSHEPSE